jgi:predicted TIM-barrel fold metal-dependent hydrolase
MDNSNVIDADGHIIERRDELRPYLKSPFDKRGGPLTASEPWDRDLQQTLPTNQELYPRVPSAEDWLRVMDAHKIERAFLYPTSLGNVSRVREPDYAVALCEAYNDYVHDYYAKVSPRLSPIALIPFQDPERAVIELRRAVKDLGCRGAVVRTTGLRMPLGHRFYDPIYREAEVLGCAIAVHGTNGAEELASGSFETFTEVHTVSFPVGIFVQFSNMIFQGVPERFPKLRLAFLEIGCTWLPYWLDRMDEHWEKRGKIETPLLTQRPSACVRQRPIYFSLESEETLLPETFRYIGDEHFVYATDIPHWDTEFPENLENVQKRKDLSDETKNKLLYENAKALYQI